MFTFVWQHYDKKLHKHLNLDLFATKDFGSEKFSFGLVVNIFFSGVSGISQTRNNTERRPDYLLVSTHVLWDRLSVMQSLEPLMEDF